jgi:tRNA G10  N-methylase Trm11
MLDPYAGTGSILVAAAAFGAQVMGADIDVRVSNSISCPSLSRLVGEE